MFDEILKYRFQIISEIYLSVPTYKDEIILFHPKPIVFESFINLNLTLLSIKIVYLRSSLN